MSYKLKLLPAALKEWKKLNPHTQSIFKKKLAQRLNNPKIEKDKLTGELSDCYKIKLRQLGYRLIYKVNTKKVVILVISVGKRNKLFAYKNATNRLNKNNH